MAAEFARWDDIDVHYRGEVRHLRRPRLRGDEPRPRCCRSSRSAAPTSASTVQLPDRGAADVERTGRRATTSSSPPTASTRRSAPGTPTPSGPSLDAPATAATCGSAPTWSSTPSASTSSRHAVRRHAGPRLPLRRARLDVHRRDARARSGARAGFDALADRRLRARRVATRVDRADRRDVRRHARRPRADRQQLAAGSASRPSATSTGAHGNVVLLGDAAHTAHFSIGSGTKLAMEDALALAACLHETRRDVAAALAAYEAERRPVVASTQRAAQASLEWFENLGAVRRPGAAAVRVQPADPQPPGHLRQPAAARPGVRRPRSTRGSPTASGSAAECARRRCSSRSRLRELELANRVVVSPMDMYSARRRHARRLPPGAPRRQGARRRRAGDDRDDLRLAGRPHHARAAPGSGPTSSATAWRRIVDFVHGHSRPRRSASSSATPAARARPS